MVKLRDKREYDQLDSLSSSSDAEISRLSVIVKDRVESLERNQTEMMDKLNTLEKKDTM